jgi:hypothetical protein
MIFLHFSQLKNVFYVIFFQIKKIEKNFVRKSSQFTKFSFVVFISCMKPLCAMNLFTL